MSETDLQRMVRLIMSSDDRQAPTLARFMDALPICLSYVDEAQVYRLVNQTYCEWFDRDRATIVGRHVRDVIGQAAYFQARRDIELVLTGRSRDWVRNVPYPSGTRRVRGLLMPDTQPDGNVVGYFAAFIEILPPERRLLGGDVRD